ncbi:MAG: hypothetical protein Q9166_005435 [cf. Caloplaca sp. 2 TL-2023]
MLSRGNSEASARLRRAKSSASIKTRRSLQIEPDIPDPFVAKEQALAAAFHAYGRANASEIPSRGSFETTSQYRTPHIEQHLTRSKSIRFAGSTAQPGHRVPITMRAAPPNLVDLESRRRSLHPELRRQNSSIQGEDGFMTALPSHGEYVETRVASQPSSYRRLRKSKSMFTPGLLSSAALSTVPRSNTQATLETTGQHAGSRLGRSFSFLRPNVERGSFKEVSSDAMQSEAIGLARDQYRRQLEQQASNTRPGKPNQVIRRRSQKTFRKSVRTSSGNSYGSTVESPTSSAGGRIERKGLGGRARDLSSTFKNRFKRVFNRSSEEEAIFPAQQLRATRPHFGNPTTPYATSDSQHQTSESLNNSTPDPMNVEKADILHIPRRRSSRAGSVGGANGDLNDHNAQSRVTSWANSTAANTVSSHQTLGPKRLSIIREGDGAPSRLGSLQQPGIDSQSQPRKSSLYAKLQQRIAKSNNISQSNTPHVDNDNTPDYFTISADMATPSNSVTPEARNGIPNDQAQTRPMKPASGIHNSEVHSKEHIPASQHAKVVRMDTKAENVKGQSPKRPLRESKSMFFPQSTRIDRTRTSPFRQAMQSSGRSEKTLGTNVASSPLEKLGKSSYLSAPSRERDRSLTRSESVYSRTSSGDTPPPPGSSTSLARLENDWEPFVATIPPNVKLEDRLQASATETSIARRTGHKKEHAQIDGDDTDLGRLQPSISIIKGSSVSSRTGIENRPLPGHTSSQPMVERFPLMSISTQANANNDEQMPPISRRVTTRYTSENENRPPTNRLGKDIENLNVKRLGASPASPRNRSQEGSEQHKGDRSGLLATPPKIGSLPAISPTSHSRSSPERIARLRRMQSSNTMGSPSLRRHFESSPKTYAATRDSPGYRGGLRGDQIGLASDGRKLVDVFLSNRAKSPSDGGEDTVFI